MEQSNDLEPYLLSRAGDTKIYLNNNKFTLGRGLNNSYIIEDLKISRTHCLFEKISGVWCLSDESSNGTFLNHKKLTRKTPHILSDRDVIKLTETIAYIFVDKKKDSLDDVDFTVLDEPDSLVTGSIIEIVTSDESNTDHRSGNREPINTVADRNAYVNMCTCNIADDPPSLSNNAIIVPSINEHTYCVNTRINAESDDIETNTVGEASTISKNNGGETSKASSNEKPQCSKGAFEHCEDELQCIICTELFIKARTLNCSHSFCKFCIEEWNRKSRKCPICRAKITVITPTIVLDNFIAKILETASQDIKERRAEIIKEREKQETVPPIIIKGGRVLRSRQVAPIEISSEEDSYDEDEDNDYGDDYYEDSYNGVRGAYFGGYGHCYSCGDAGHWANGCPYR